MQERTVTDKPCDKCGEHICVCNLHPSDKPSAREWLYGAEYWVPEEHMFKTGNECLEAFPDSGPACGVVSTTAYGQLSAKLEVAERERDKWREKLRCVYCVDHTEHAVRIESLEKERDELGERFQKFKVYAQDLETKGLELYAECERLRNKYDLQLLVKREDKLKDEIEHLSQRFNDLARKHEELLSYLPKVPTEPYERELARKLTIAQRALEEAAEFANSDDFNGFAGEIARKALEEILSPLSGTKEL